MSAHENMAAALAAFQAEIPHIGKGNTAQVRSDKGNYSYKYADLSDVVAKVMPVLAKHGLSFSAKPTLNEDGKFVLEYTLRHASGEKDTGFYPLSTGTPQQVGSSITYGRRYCLCAVTGVAPDEDDDGAAAQSAQAYEEPERPTARRQAPTQRQQPTNGEVKPTTKADLEKRAAAAVQTMLAAGTVDDAEKMVGRASNSPAKDIRVDGLLTAEQREILGLSSEPHTLHDMAVVVLAYVEKHGKAVALAGVPA